jgi:hypothetical protein
MKYLKIFLAIGLLSVTVIFFSRCLQPGAADADPRGDRYAGAETCAGCHQKIVNSYAHTHHYKTSAEVTTEYLKRLTASSRDRFYFMDSSYIHIEERDSTLFQTYYINNQKDVSEKFDIAFGSAEKAQTYGYWKENKLYELPLTYFTVMNTWANSPGFPGRHARWGRVIESRCFECHASYVDREMVQTGPMSVSERLKKNSIILGIDCERCHGPAADHVKFQQENPTAKEGRYIVSMRLLSRQQRLDLCSVCHSGNDQSTQRSLFDFIPGDTLSHFFYPDFGSGSSEPDVHGKQLQLLQSSMCYKQSNITCNTCHNAHETEGNKMESFISKCMDCHQNSAHAATVIKENKQIKRDYNLIGRNCIDCHMPLQTSKTIYFNNGAEIENMPYLIRTHKISIYKQ